MRCKIGTKFIQKLGKAIRHPSRAVVRLVLNARMSRTDAALERARLLEFLSSHFDTDVAALHEEYLRSDFARWYRARRAELQRFSGPARLGTTDGFGCEALYLLVRAARPRVVVETGVLYGASSAHILAALDHNGAGELNSIELGRDPREPPHDFLVPPRLTRRWNLVLGDSRHELVRLLARLPAVDLFHHDSLHTHEHMTWEFETALPHLAPGGVISSDDVLRPHSARRLFQRNAFLDFCERHRLPWTKSRNIGVAVRPQRQAQAERHSARAEVRRFGQAALAS